MPWAGRRAYGVGAALVLLAVASVVGATADRSDARAARSTTPVSSWIVDGTVYAIAATAKDILLGGDFTLIGRPTGTWATVDPSGAVRVRSAVTDTVGNAVTDGRGGWYLAGDIGSVGGVARTRIVHLLPTGRLDVKWHPEVNGAVNALVRIGSTLYLGGEFTRFGGLPRSELAAVDIATGAVNSWSPSLRAKKDQGLLVSVLARSADGKTIFVGGEFSRLGGQQVANLGAVDATAGKARAWHPIMNGDVTALDATARVVYAGGDFTKADGQPRSGLAALNLTTGKPTRWNPDCDGSVTQIVVAPAGSPVFIAGEFASIGEKSRRGLAAVDNRSGAATPWDPNVAGFANSIALDTKQHLVYVGGEFDSVGDLARSNLAAVDTRTGLATGWNPGAIGDVDVVAQGPTGALAVGGEFESVGAVPRTSLAELAPDGSLAGWAPQMTGTVRAITATPDGSRFYVGGRFTVGDSRTQQSLAIADPAGQTVTPWGPAVNSGVWAIAPSPDGQSVYLGGAFTTVGGKTRKRLAQLDATGALTAWNAGANALVRRVVLSGDQLWAAGDFGSIGGESRKGIASLDIATALATGWDAGSDDNVDALAVTDQSIYVGGEFTSIGGRSRKYLAQLDPADGSAMRWDPSPDDAVNGLAVSPNGASLLVVGDFVKISGGQRDIGEFDVATGLLSAWRPEAPFSADALAFSPDSSTVYVGGEEALTVYR